MHGKFSTATVPPQQAVDATVGLGLSRRRFGTLLGTALAGSTLAACGGGGGSGLDVAGKKAALQAVLDRSVSGDQAPFLVGMVVNADGTPFSGAAGNAATGRPADLDTVMAIFSATKAIGSLAAMILIDRGLLSIDTPVEKVLPAFAGVKVLDGYDPSGRPVFRAPKTQATIRHLATHTSGLEYEFWQPGEAAYLKATGGRGILASTNLQAALLSEYPMMTDPGTRWGYGVSIDWLGLVVERVSGQKIADFLRTNIFDPLGMGDTDVVLRDDMKSRLATVSFRGADGKFGAFPLAPPATTDSYGMGHALYSTPRDYAKFLRLILNRGSLGDKKVISEAAAAEMLKNQMPDGLNFQDLISASPLSADFKPFAGIPKTHGFGFMRVEQNVPGMRRAGSVAWAGVCNSHYWIDLQSGIAGLFMTQSLPFVETPFMAGYEAFERATYG
ncbi:serine hydrolase domain-containing protein [Paracidovorax oryzae]|uniref:serine hydrolase domain-containing protein n=1 Tax=Paracidovorax oryzae TaxID=862720 RepID=UPI0012FF1D8B|nr:serine hydrolase domain-containing protein [Paracidovorax oryzae]